MLIEGLEMNKQRFTNRNGRQRRRMTTLASMLGLAFGTALSALPMHAQAAPFDISQVPIDLGGALEPNLLYIHDDSGSMKWAYLPDSISGVSARNAAKSPSYNKMYFNPTVSYSPPLDHEGNSLGDASFTAAWVNGYASNRNSDKRDLSSVGKQFLPHWSAYNSAISGSGSGSQAYYYRYKPSGSSCPADSPNTNDACYEEVKVPDVTLSAEDQATQKQNFANWYSYYRVREFAARAGVSRAFATLGENARVGYGRIYKGNAETIDGKSVSTLIKGIRKFQGADRKNFFDWILDYSKINHNGDTPLRRALDDAGKYYENDNANGPWSTTPGIAGGKHLACRKSFTIMMTDGGWNSNSATTAAARANTDGTSGPTITGPGGGSYTYSPVAPYLDSAASADPDLGGTLADVAMYYWKRDLRPDLDNKVPTTADDPAFWQHMGVFTIGLGAVGKYNSIAEVKQRAADGLAVEWGSPAGTNLTPGKTDDLLHAALNGHGGFFSATDPDEFVTSLSAVLASIGDATKSSASVAASSTRAVLGTMLYQVKYRSDSWTGDLTGYKYNPDTEGVDWAWDASAVLPSANSRNIYTSKTEGGTWSPTTFTWSDLSPAQQALLSIPATWQAAAPAAQLTPQDLLAYLRGDGSNEGEGLGKFRKRGTNKIGDIVHSAPIYVGTVDQGFGAAAGMNSTEQSAYVTRKNDATYKGRSKMLYAGANDGMLHAFDALTGVEKFAYVPSTAFEKVIPTAPHGKLATLAAQDYAHKYFVDGPLSASDAYIGSAWKTVLVGSTGAGGRTYFALDVERPDSFGPSNVLWEFTHDELGTAIGQASIVKVENGNWVAIFGNGYNSQSNTARLFVVDLATGSLLRMIDTQVGTTVQPNGLAAPAAVDTNSNGVVDAVYAGDMQGNMWRFDFKGSVSDWRVSFATGTTPKPLFRAVDAFGNAQPIMTSPSVRRNPYRSGTIVYFGTGQFFEVGDQVITARQSIYGVYDECGLSFTAPASCYSVSGAAKVARANLVQQRIVREQLGADFDGQAQDIRVVTQNSMGASNKGFYLDLLPPSGTVEGERVINSPNGYFSDRIVFTSFIPNADPCDGEGSGWLYELNPFTGGRTEFSVFDLNNDGFFNSSEFTSEFGGSGDAKVAVSGRRLPGGVTPTVLNGDTKAILAHPGPNGTNIVTNRPEPDFGRQAWQDIH